MRKGDASLPPPADTFHQRMGLLMSPAASGSWVPEMRGAQLCAGPKGTSTWGPSSRTVTGPLQRTVCRCQAGWSGSGSAGHQDILVCAHVAPG